MEGLPRDFFVEVRILLMALLLSYLLRTYMHHYQLCVCTYIMQSGMHGDKQWTTAFSYHVCSGWSCLGQGGFERAAREGIHPWVDACMRTPGLAGLCWQLGPKGGDKGSSLASFRSVRARLQWLAGSLWVLARSGYIYLAFTSILCP